MTTIATLGEVYECLDEKVGFSFEEIRKRLRIKRGLEENPPRKLIARIFYALSDPLPESIRLKLDYLTFTLGIVEGESRDPNSRESEAVYRKVKDTELVLTNPVRFAY